MSLISFVLKTIAKSGEKTYNELNTITKNPMKEQKDFLFSILDKNKNTELGKKLGYENIHSIEDFQKNIPLTDYDYYTDFIKKMINCEPNIITVDKTVHFNMSSGTIGNPKKIPINEDHVQMFSKYYTKYMYHLFSRQFKNKWAKGKCLSLVEGKYTILPSGISYGCASSLYAARMGTMAPFLDIDMLKFMYTSPAEARRPEPGTPTRFLHALFALREKNITYANTTFSSFLLELMRYIEKNWKTLTEVIRTGVFPTDIDLSEEMKKTLKKKLKPSKKRADELTRIFEEGFDKPIMKRLWPNLTGVLMVGGAGFQVYTDKLRHRYCGDDIKFLFLGLSASEGMFSVPYEFENLDAVFVPNGAFLEFVPVSDDGTTDYNSTPLTLDKVEVGKSYEIIATTQNGFVRYKMKDVITITGKRNNTPTMQFRKRTGFAISMYSEKTSEAALTYMVEKTAEEMGFDYYDYAVCPDMDQTPGRYVLCLEIRDCDIEKLDKEKIRACAMKHISKANPYFDNVMKRGIAAPLELKLLEPETFLLYRDLMIYKGYNATQLKPLHVLDNPFLKNFFYNQCYKFDN